MGQASPHPIVITTSAARTTSSVSGFGNSSLMSIPSSVMASTTAGLISSAGVLPAERTWIRPRDRSLTRPAAIWLRPALWTQTNSTSGLMAHSPQGIDAHQCLGQCDNRIDRCQYFPVKPIATLAATCPPLLAGPLDVDEAANLADALRVIADPARLRILSLIQAQPAREACVCHLTEPL